MSTPTPEPTAAAVVADVHEVLDATKADVQDAVANIEHAGFGHLVDDAKALVERVFSTLKQDLHNLIHGAPSEPAVPTQASPPTTT